MADPLSITAGILAILGACSTSIRVVKSCCNAPHEIRRLEVEVIRLAAVVRDVQGLGPSMVTCSEGLADTLETARLTVEEVSRFIQEWLYQAKNATQRARRGFYFRKRNKTKDLSQELMIVRSELTTHMMASTLYM
jgi:hypothetical protein